MEAIILQKNDFLSMADYIIDGISKRLGNEKSNPQELKLYSNKDACKILKVCNKTLQNYRDSGVLEFAQIGRKIFYTEENLNTFLANNKKELFNL